MQTFYSLLLAFVALTSVRSASWTISQTINPSDYNNQFDYFTQQDPTGGLVLYQSQTDAQANNLTGVSNGKFYMRVDTTPVQTEGRRSIRLSSKQTYSDGVYVLNVSHVPTGCSVWPAYWFVTQDLSSYPNGGEIDVFENANDLYNGALVSLHTKDNCINPRASQSGIATSTNCSVYVDGNPGCSTVMNGTSAPSWGSRFNAQGGGIVAMERALGSTGSGVRVWYWPQGSQPSDLSANSQSVDPSTWGTPGANFPIANSCHSDFGPHRITFDISLCGSFAAGTYNQSGCNLQYPACSYQVGYNGSSYNQSYWSIGALRVFASGGGSDNAANSPNTSQEKLSSGAIMTSLPLKLASAGLAILAGAMMLLV